MLQVSLPCVLFAASPSELRLRGGTNAEMAPQIDYTAMVRAFGARTHHGAVLELSPEWLCVPSCVFLHGGLMFAVELVLWPRCVPGEPLKKLKCHDDTNSLTYYANQIWDLGFGGKNSKPE